jgi:AcrR family transcriptional regulator
MTDSVPEQLDGETGADWHRRVVGRSLRKAADRSVDRGMNLIRAAATVLDRSGGEDITVQEVADEAGQSLRTLYQYFESKDDLLLAVFEEAMRTYAELIARAISDLTGPLERLAGGLLAMVHMPGHSDPARARGLSRLRLRLSESQPELVARAQSSVTTLLRGLVEDAATAGHVSVADAEAATFMLVSLNTSFITAETLGSDTAVARPDAHGMVAFCLRGLGAEVDERLLQGVDARLRFRTASGNRKRSPDATRRS